MPVPDTVLRRVPPIEDSFARDCRMFGALLGALRAFRTTDSQDDGRMADADEIAAISRFLAQAAQPSVCPVTRCYMGIDLRPLDLARKEEARRLDIAFMTQMILP